MNHVCFYYRLDNHNRAIQPQPPPTVCNHRCNLAVAMSLPSDLNLAVSFCNICIFHASMMA